MDIEISEIIAGYNKRIGELTQEVIFAEAKSAALEKRAQDAEAALQEREGDK